MHEICNVWSSRNFESYFLAVATPCHGAYLNEHNYSVQVGRKAVMWFLQACFIDWDSYSRISFGMFCFAINFWWIMKYLIYVTDVVCLFTRRKSLQMLQQWEGRGSVVFLQLRELLVHSPKIRKNRSVYLIFIFFAIWCCSCCVSYNDF